MVALVKKHQLKGPLQPLSLVIMHTPVNMESNREEQYLRGRAVELSQSFSEGSCSKEAIIAIGRTLMNEGLGDIHIHDEIVDILKGQGFETVISTQEGHIIIAYHNLIWKTAEGWTLPRQVGECEVTPFLPHLLEVTQMHMNAETVKNGESYQSEDSYLRADIEKFIDGPENWAEVSILEFFNSALPNSCQLQGLKSQPIVKLISSKDNKLSWKDACDNDEVNGDKVFANESSGKMYVRRQTDYRILFEERPDAMSEMPLGQLAAEYRLCEQKKKETEEYRSKIDERTGLGPLSTTLVAGTERTVAPQAMLLKNGRILVRRKNKAILQLRYHTTTTKYLSFLLWSPWWRLENIEPDQEPDETEAQMMSRLSIFPMSICENVVEED